MLRTDQSDHKGVILKVLEDGYPHKLSEILEATAKAAEDRSFYARAYLTDGAARNKKTGHLPGYVWTVRINDALRRLVNKKMITRLDRGIYKLRGGTTQDATRQNAGQAV